MVTIFSKTLSGWIYPVTVRLTQCEVATFLVFAVYLFILDLHVLGLSKYTYIHISTLFMFRKCVINKLLNCSVNLKFHVK